MKILFTALDLQHYAKYEMQLELSTADAERITRLSVANVKAQLATLKHNKTASYPPFVIDKWRSMSAVRRRLFGHAKNVMKYDKRQKREVPTTERENSVVKISEKLSGVLHVRDGSLRLKPMTGWKAIIFNQDMWLEKTVDSPSDANTLAVLKLHADNNPADHVMKIQGQRLRDSVPGSKAAQLTTLFEVTTEPWAFQAVPTPGDFPITGAELGQLAILFGLNGQPRSKLFRQQDIEILFINKFNMLVFRNSYLTVIFTKGTKLV